MSSIYKIYADRDYVESLISTHNSSQDAHGDINTAVNEINQSIATLSNELEQVSDFVQEKTEDKFDEYIRYDNGDLEVGHNDSDYKVQVNNDNVSIIQSGKQMATFSQNTVSAPNFQASNMVKIGNHTIKISTSGALIFN